MHAPNSGNLTIHDEKESELVKEQSDSIDDLPHSGGGANAKDLEQGAPQVDATTDGIIMDGGARAWATVAGGFLVALVTWGYINAFGVFQDVYTRGQGLHGGVPSSAQRISWIGSIQLFLIQSVGFVAGKALDMGWFRWTNAIGTVIFVFSLFMVSLAHHDNDSYYQLLLSQGIGMGIGSGLLYVPALAIQGHHWRKRRALAMGIVITGSSVGGIIWPLMLNSSSTDFVWSVRASAFLCLGLLVIANFLMRTNPAVVGKGSADLPKPDMKGILTDVPFMLTAFAVFLSFWGIFFSYFYLQLFTILHHIDTKIAFYTIAVLNGTSLFGRIIPNLFADRVGPLTIITPSSFLCGALVFVFYSLDKSITVAATMGFSIVYGFFSGTFLALCPPTIGTFARHPGEMGARFGVAFLISSFGALTGPPIDGALLGETYPWGKAIVFSGVSGLGGFILFALSLLMVAKRKGTRRV